MFSASVRWQGFFLKHWIPSSLIDVINLMKQLLDKYLAIIPSLGNG